MNTITAYLTHFFYSFSLLSWKDPVEIIFFSSIIYYFSLWLKQDSYKPLLSIFYTYCIVLIGSSLFYFNTVHTFLLLYGPLFLMMLIVVHQELLQRNFVSLHKITKLSSSTREWLEIFVRLCLRARGNKKSVLCIIEQTDNLESFIQAPYSLGTPLHEQLLTLLLESPLFEQHHFMVLTRQGTIKTINATLNIPLEKTWISEDLKKDAAWVAQACILTSKTDALVIKSDAQSGTFDIIAQGKQVDALSAASAIRIMNHYLQHPELSKQKKETILYEKTSFSQRNSVDQSHH